ncbi:MAG TPA: hypothetical protein VE959_31060 [Bryobacteraceae bacterium]|nr:hypothetical protein [Bryobacteraceae bacterium]
MSPAARAGPSARFPFVGLRPFRTDESLLFFGRREQTVELMESLHRTHFVAVVGTSGCGKSSLVYAGLIPKLEAGFLAEDRDRWMSASMNPGGRPMWNLARAVLTGIGSEPDAQSVDALRSDIGAGGAAAIVDRLAPALARTDANFLLLVDQFEEIFPFGVHTKDAARRDEAADMVSILLALAEQRTAPVYIVITMRSDFLGDCEAFPSLPEAMNRSQYLVPRLTRQQRREAVEGPIRLFGESITPQLLDRVLNDGGDESDQLPVMQHAMLRCWEEWQKQAQGPLDIPHYEAVGTIRGALSRDAEAALKGSSEAVAERFFQALTDTDAGNRRVRRAAKLSEIEAITGARREELEGIVERFSGHGRSFLAVSDDPADPLIKISHESLIRQWDRLRKWVDDESASRAIYRRVAEAAMLHKEGRAAYWRNPDLQLALDWRKKRKPNAAWARRTYPDFDGAMAFLEGSRKNRLLKLWLTAGAVILVSVVLGRQLWRDSADYRTYRTNLSKAEAGLREAERATQTALNQQKEIEASVKAQSLALQLSLNADDAHNTGSGEEGIVAAGLLAVESLRAYPTFQGRRRAAWVLGLLPHRVAVWGSQGSELVSAAYSNDGRWLATGGSDGTVVVRNTANGAPLKRLTVEGQVCCLAFSKNGRLLAAGALHLTVWNTETWNVVKQLEQRRSGILRVTSVAFNRDGTLLAVADNSGSSALVLDTANWSERKPGTDVRAISAVTFTQDGGSLIEASGDWIRIWPVKGGPLRNAYSERVRNAVFGPDGLWADIDFEEIVVRRLEEPAPWATRTEIHLPIRALESAVSFSPDGKSLAVASTDGVRIMRLSDKREVARIPERASAIAFHPNGHMVATVNTDSQRPITVWQIDAGLEPIRMHESAPVRVLGLSANTKWLAIGGVDRMLRVVELATQKEVVRKDLGGKAAAIAFSPDDRFCAVGAGRNVRVFDTAGWHEVISLKTGGSVSRLAFREDSRWLVSVADSGKEKRQVQLFETSSWHSPGPIDGGDLQDVSFSPDGRWFSISTSIPSSSGPSSFIWTVFALDTGKAAGSYTRHPDKSIEKTGNASLARESMKWNTVGNPVSFYLGVGGVSADGNWGVLPDIPDDIGLTLKDARTEEDLALLERGQEVQDVEISSDGGWLAVAEDNEVHLYSLAPEDLIRQLCARLTRNFSTDEWTQVFHNQPYRKTCPSLPVPVDSQ